jgi:hypothetical protein
VTAINETTLPINKMNKGHIPVVPTEIIPPPWDEAIEIAKKITPSSDAAISSAHAALHRYAQASWECSFHWFIKLKWNRKHKIPFANEWSKLLEPVGWLLYSLLELCKEAHCQSCEETKNYNHASEWFSLICPEILDRYFFDSKSQCLRKLREDLKVLKDCEEGFKNPYSIEENLHLHRLFTVCINLTINKPQFEKDYLRSKGTKKGKRYVPPGFIQALSTWATELDRNPDLGQEERDRVKAAKLNQKKIDRLSA